MDSRISLDNGLQGVRLGVKVARVLIDEGFIPALPSDLVLPLCICFFILACLQTWEHLLTF